MRNIQLSDHFTYRKLLQFTFPSIVMMVFTSIYGVVDGFFISNYVGKTSFASTNLIYPYLMAMGAVGFMVGTGGSALISKTLGEGRREQANRLFSMLVYLTIGAGAALAVIGILILRPVALLLGAEGDMVEICVLYGRINLAALPAFMLQFAFQSFFVTAERPRLGLLVTVAAGVANMVLDALFMAVFHWGVAGAALATAASQVIGGVLPLFYFFRPNDSLLRLGKTSFDGRALARTCSNGASELMSNLASSLVSVLFNYRLMQLTGADGVSAYGVMMYVQFVFAAVFLGYSIGSAPLTGFHYGAGNQKELKNLLKKSLVLLAVSSVALTLTAEALAMPLSHFFVGYDPGLLDLTYQAFRVFSLNFLFCAASIYGSSFFTALNNGLVSALISFLRTLVFQTGCVLILPAFWGLNGVWFSVTAAEALALAVTAFFLLLCRKKYGYM